jgi:hypothetical protein
VQRIEYRTIDKSGWGEGPWQSEPDKIQWQDPDTGYPCLIVRNGMSMGFLCGYVGVPANHPAHGLSYDGELYLEHKEHMKKSREAMRKNHEAGKSALEGEFPERPKVVNEHLSEIEVHGGMTFAEPCASMGREDWIEYAKYINSPGLKAEASQYSEGDAARRIAEWKDAVRDYDKWRAECESKEICHKPDPGEADDVWWFGFDCGHAWDLSPGMKKFQEDHGFSHHNEDMYRDVAYVASEVERLAQQLKAMEVEE